MIQLTPQSLNLSEILLGLNIFFYLILLNRLGHLLDCYLMVLQFFLINLFEQSNSMFSSQYLLFVPLFCLTITRHSNNLQKMIKDIKQNINFAKIAEQTQRYEDMVNFIRDVIKTIRSEKAIFHQEEIRLFCNAYKCKINSRRTAWRALQILYAKEANTKNRSSAVILYYKDNIEKQIREICQEVISIIDSIFKVQKLKLSIKLELYKMRGDFHRYLCEISKDSDELKKIQKECQITYKKGIEEFKLQQKKDAKQKKQSQIQTYDAKRLAIYLNLSVFYYQIMLSLPKAIETCEQGFNSALENISDLEQAKYIDSVTIMQLMHDNITAWKSEKQKSK